MLWRMRRTPTRLTQRSSTPIRRWKKKKKPDMIVAFTNANNAGVVKEAFAAMQEKESNWHIDEAVEKALPKKTRKKMRREGWKEVTPLERGCQDYIETKLLKGDALKRFLSTWRYFELRHQHFIDNLPKYVKAMYNNMKSDPGLGAIYRSRWGFQKTNMVVKYLAGQLLVSEPTRADQLMKEYRKLQQRDRQSGVQFYDLVTTKRNQLLNRVKPSEYPKDKSVVAHIMTSLRPDYGMKLDSEPYSNWTLQHLRTRLERLDSRLQEIRSAQRNQQTSFQPGPRGNPQRNFESNPRKRPSQVMNMNSSFHKKPRNTGLFQPSHQGGQNQRPQIPAGFQRIRCSSCGLYGHLSKNCRKTPKCFNCGQPGHIATNCPKRSQAPPPNAKPVSFVQQHTGQHSEDFHADEDAYTIAAAHADETKPEDMVTADDEVASTGTYCS